MNSQHPNGVFIVIQPGPFIVEDRFAGAALHPVDECSQARRLAGLECTRLLDDEPRAPEAITVAGVEDANLDLLRLCHKAVHQRCDRAIVSCLMMGGQRPQRVGDSPWQHLQPRREIVPGPAGSLVLRQLDIGAGERCAAKRGNDRHFIGWIVDRCKAVEQVAYLLRPVDQASALDPVRQRCLGKRPIQRR